MVNFLTKVRLFFYYRFFLTPSIKLKDKTVFTKHPSTEREKKNLLFLSLIKNHKSTSRTELSKLTDTNVVTVSNYVNSYLKKGLVLERGYDISSGGRRPELVEINKRYGYFIGIYIEKEYIRGALTDLGMEILANESMKLKNKPDIENSLQEIITKIQGSSKIEKTDIKKISLAASPDCCHTSEDLAGLRLRVENNLKIPALLGADALCAAFGEKNLNPKAKEAKNVLYMHRDIGEGIFIKDDDLYESSDEEKEYAYLRPWDKSLSIANEAKKVVSRGIGTKIINIAEDKPENITMDTVLKAADEEDAIAVDLIKSSAMNLSVRIAYLVNFLKPEVVIVGGGIEKAGDRFLKVLEKSVERLILGKISENIKLTTAILGENACTKGGALLAIREICLEA